MRCFTYFLAHKNPNKLIIPYEQRIFGFSADPIYLRVIWCNGHFLYIISRPQIFEPFKNIEFKLTYHFQKAIAYSPIKKSLSTKVKRDLKNEKLNFYIFLLTKAIAAPTIPAIRILKAKSNTILL